MKLGLILLLFVVVVQKEAVEAEQLENGNTNDVSDPPLESQPDSSHEQNKDNSVSNGTNSQSQGGQSDSFVQFSGDLYQAMKESQSQNFILSPLSVRNALAMLSLGATGETAEEMQKVLQLPADPRELIKRQSNLIASLKNISSSSLGLRFATGDAVFTNARIRVKQQFRDHVTRLGGETDRVNFATGFAAAKKINAWVRTKTEGKIEKFVEPSDLNDQMSLLVLNTIYFKGAWKHEFNVSKTKQRPFFLNASCSMNVEMMTQENEFQHANLEEAKAQVLILPYQGKRLSMMIYLPWKKEEGALDTLENWLSTKSPFDIQREHFNENQLSTVSVSLPKFKIRSSLDLNEPLKTLGLEKMFDAVAGNFSGIFNDSRNFFVSKVSQKTFIEVNEKGTEAAAVTGFELSATSVGSVFTADRPFLFQIVDSETKTVLFSGRVKNPLDGTVVSGSEDGGPRCIGVKSKVEELLIDFANFLAPNETEPHNILSRAARFQALVGKYGNGTAGAMEFIQLLDNTLDRLERTEEKLRDVKEAHNVQDVRAQELERAKGRFEWREKELRRELVSQNETIKELRKENGRLQVRIDQQVVQPNCHREDLTSSGKGAGGPLACIPRAQAEIFVCRSYYDCSSTTVDTYDATRDGSCKHFNYDIKSVKITGSCVTLFQNNDCSGMQLQLDIRTGHLGQIQQVRTYYRGPRSIGPCWQWSNV